MQNVALDCAGGSGGDGCTSDLCGVLLYGLRRWLELATRSMKNSMW